MEDIQVKITGDNRARYIFIPTTDFRFSKEEELQMLIKASGDYNSHYGDKQRVKRHMSNSDARKLGF